VSSPDEDRVVPRRTATLATDREGVSRRLDLPSRTYTGGLAAMGVVLAMIVAGALAFKRYGARFRAAVGAGGRTMEIVSRLALSPKQSLCLIRLGRQLVLVGVTPEQIGRLLVIDDSETVAELIASSSGQSGKGPGSAFGRLFSRESATFDDLVEAADVPAETPLGSDDRRFRQARLELSGLLDKLRSRQSPEGRASEETHGSRGRDPIAVA
jgi:flagellar biogenesis protein FliO